MCGRIEYVVEKRQLEEHYGATLIEGYAEQGIITPRYNVAPSSMLAVVPSEESAHLVAGRWGFKPAWAGTGKIREVINARAETAAASPYFREAFKRRRCLVPVSAFFEWRHDGAQKTPYRVHLAQDLFSLAGLYTADRAARLLHFAILTTQANDDMKPIHDRMPVIIDPGDYARWLNNDTQQAKLQDLLQPWRGDLECYKIGKRINNPRNDSPDVIEPVA